MSGARRGGGRREVEEMAAGDTSPGAARMRLLRERRTARLRVLRLEVRDAEVRALIRRGMLAPDRQDDRRAIAEALGKFLDRALT